MGRDVGYINRRVQISAGVQSDVGVLSNNNTGNNNRKNVLYSMPVLFTSFVFEKPVSRSIKDIRTVSDERLDLFIKRYNEHIKNDYLEQKYEKIDSIISEQEDLDTKYDFRMKKQNYLHNHIKRSINSITDFMTLHIPPSKKNEIYTSYMKDLLVVDKRIIDNFILAKKRHKNAVIALRERAANYLENNHDEIVSYWNEKVL